jgi:hypothetical protein
MDWTPIYAALAQAATLSGIPASAIAWSDQPAAATWASGPTMAMRISPERSYGWDEEERTDPPAPNPGNLPQTVNVAGQREFTWQIRVQVQNSDPATIAVRFLDRLRVRLQRTTTETQILLPAGLAVIQIMPTVPIVNVKDNRTISTHVMEVLMGAVENDLDDTLGAGDYIAQVGILSNKLQSPDGNDAPQQIVLTVGP